MRRTPIRSNIRPKISTMPRQQTEAAAYLDIYKLVVEKKRLQDELESIQQRQGQISDRLSVIEAQIQTIEDKAHQIRDAQLGETSEPSETSERKSYSGTSSAPRTEQPSQFKTITLEY
ncbi:MAG: hypothetical protein AAF327_21395 [Cyanobacteria bacterium P01_A01_bin.37]